jgi:hypothetical protein
MDRTTFKVNKEHKFQKEPHADRADTQHIFGNVAKRPQLTLLVQQFLSNTQLFLQSFASITCQ